MLSRIFSYIHGYKKYLWIAMACILAESVFELIVPLLMADIVNVGVETGDRTYIF